MATILEIKKSDSDEEIERKLQEFLKKRAEINLQSSEERKRELSKFFGILKLSEDPLKLQKKWRKEW